MSVYRGPKIVADNLVMLMDAADKNSYSGGSTWIDVSKNNNNGTIENSPTYVDGQLSYFTLNGSTQRIVCGNATSLQITVGTIDSWVYPLDNVTAHGIITKQNAWGLFVVANKLQSYDWGNSVYRDTGITIGNTGKWYHVAMTFTETVGTPSNNAVIYINGSAVLTTTVKHSLNTVQVMLGEANSSQYLTGNIASASIYNRVLSSTEILQNYNSKKSRFNLQ